VLNRRRFQGSHFKTSAELVGDFSYLSRRQSVTVYSQQLGEIVIEVDEVEADARISIACNRYLSASEPERSQCRLKHRATHGVKDSIDTFSRRSFQDFFTKIFDLGIDDRFCTRNRIECGRHTNHVRLLPIRNLCGRLSHRARGANN
jgi:hypothetical protein